jgi:hypothetical protein
MENPNFLKQKYNLHNTPEAESAAKRTEVRSGEKVPQKPDAQIQNYLDRFKEIIDRPDEEKREQGMNALKHILYNKFVIKPEEIPESYFTTQQRLARELGHGEVEIGEEQRKQLTEVIITDQKSSLDNWTDYLSSKDATYPDWLKYYSFRSMLSLGEYDKENKQFTKRSKTTTKPFPDLNREALAYVLDVIEKKYQPQTEEQKKLEVEKRIQKEVNLSEEEKQAKQEEQINFEKILQGENFAKLYAWAIDKVTPASKERLASTEGKWIKYNQNSDHMPLVESLQGHSTGWCTAGESTAQTQLSNGDFYVYYSLDENGQAKIPRAAIRMEGDSIGEVRGIGPDQNLDPYIGDVVKTKMAEFPDGASYEKKSSDMKILTEIDNKNKEDKPLNKEDLIFLYEINSPIEGFGYGRDPRIQEIISTRNPKEDAPIVLECESKEIVYSEENYIQALKENRNIKAYIGPLFSNIFSQNIEHIYSSFPNGRIERVETTIGTKSKEELIKELNEREKSINPEDKIYTSDNARSMLQKPEFAVISKPEKINLIKLKVQDLGFKNNPTTEQIYKRAEELGLELCSPEVGPHLRLNYQDVFKREQAKGEWLRIGMKQITASNGDPDVFDVNRGGLGVRWLSGNLALPENLWSLEDEFVFTCK